MVSSDRMVAVPYWWPLEDWKIIFNFLLSVTRWIELDWIKLNFTQVSYRSFWFLTQGDEEELLKRKYCEIVKVLISSNVDVNIGNKVRVDGINFSPKVLTHYFSVANVDITDWTYPTAASLSGRFFWDCCIIADSGTY